MAKTIQEVIDTVVRAVGCPPIADTVDTVKSGDPSQPVRGIVTTFIATRQVLSRAVELGANLVITHEPTYYTHQDWLDWLKGDPVFESKRQFLQDNGIVVWRFHDYWHRRSPDGIYTGVLRRLGWESCADPDEKFVYDIRPTTLGGLARLMKRKLGIRRVRVTGELDMPCRRVALMVGFVNPERQIEKLGHPGVDALVCGESHEWQTCEYVRDCAAAGLKKGLIVLGHANSEEAGMEYLAEWLRPLVPEVPIEHVPAGDPFAFV